MFAAGHVGAGRIALKGIGIRAGRRPRADLTFGFRPAWIVEVIAPHTVSPAKDWRVFSIWSRRTGKSLARPVRSGLQGPASRARPVHLGSTAQGALGGQGWLMQRTVYAAIMIATAVSIARTAWVVLGFLRTLARPRASVDITWDWALFLVAPEVLLPALAALWLFYNNGAAPPYSFTRVLGALLGAGLALGGLALTIWSWLSLPSVGTGHYLLAGQPLITRGAYGAVRHPIYTGAFLIWFGLAAAYTSAVVLLLTVLYAIPAYMLNIKGEEQMLLSHYGDEYREYQRQVGAFIPRIERE